MVCWKHYLWGILSDYSFRSVTLQVHTCVFIDILLIRYHCACDHEIFILKYCKHPVISCYKNQQINVKHVCNLAFIHYEMTMDRFVDLYYAVLLLTMLSNRGLFKVSLVYSKKNFQWIVKKILLEFWL